MLSPATILEIKTELNNLRAMRSKLDERIAALEAIQEPLPLWGGQVSLPLGGNGHDSTNVVSSPYANIGLRAAILDTLKAGSMMRAPEVAKVLVQRGFQNTSKTALGTRVYNDLWRMKEAGILEGEGGAFALK